MKAYEFPAQISPEGKLEVPESLLKRLQSEQVVRVIVLVSEREDIEEQAAWNRLTSEQFLAGYSETDAIYDRM